MTTTPSSTSSIRDRLTPRDWIGWAVTLLAAVVGGVAGYFVSQASSASSPPPEASSAAPPTSRQAGPLSITIRSVEWVDDKQKPGRFRISGDVNNLRLGLLVWTYNEPLGPKGEAGLLFPDPGPCPVGLDGHWMCDVGVAGNDLKASERKSDRGRSFKLWAAIVTEDQAYAAIKTKLGLGAPGKAYASLTEAPHVDGDQSTAWREITRPR
jgi:hypothetical protein